MSIDKRWRELEALVRALPEAKGGRAAAEAVRQWLGAFEAAIFHMESADSPARPAIVGLVGGTGTGKSTLANRLLGENASAASFSRTHTLGPIAFVRDPRDLPAGWLGQPAHMADPSAIPSRGEPNCLTVVGVHSELAHSVVLIDATDIDGDRPEHYAEADRVFRWAQIALFLVTPEKYQMTELYPYCRMARRYHVPAVFAMNKCEDSDAPADYARLLAEREWPGQKVFMIPRDDSAFEPPSSAGLAALREALIQAAAEAPQRCRAGLSNRCADLLDRLRDRILEPLAKDRQEADRALGALNAMAPPETDLDAAPMLEPLRRKLREQSVFYLMGPARMLERAAKTPAMLASLPRAAWRAMTGRKPAPPREESAAPRPEKPNFGAILIDQFSVAQSRIEDALRAYPRVEAWIDADLESFRAARIDSESAGKIAEEELAALEAWLRERWSRRPRDTRAIEAVLKKIPGGQKVVEWTEAAPYLLAIALAAHHAMFGPIDLAILGGFGLAAWLGDKLSDEAASRARQSNRAIARRFARLAQLQIKQASEWIEARAPDAGTLKAIEALAEELAAKNA